MYPRRRQRSRLRSVIGRLPLFIIGMLLAVSVLLFGQEGMAGIHIGTNAATMQIAGMIGFFSVAAISIGSVMQLASASSFRMAGFAGIWVGVSIFFLMAMFVGSI